MSDATNAEVNQAVVRLDGSWRGVVVGVAEGLVTVQCQDAALRQFPAHEFFCEWRRLGSEREEGFRAGVEEAAQLAEDGARDAGVRGARAWSENVNDEAACAHNEAARRLRELAASIRKLAEGK